MSMESEGVSNTVRSAMETRECDKKESDKDHAH